MFPANKGTVKVRRAEREDAETIRRLLIKTWHHTYDSLMGPEEVTKITGAWHAIETLREQISADDQLFLVAELDGEIAGHAYALEDAPGTLNLSRLYILPSAQGKGLGRALLEHVEQHFPDSKTMHLEVHERQHQAHRFYKANGFEVIGKTAHCGGDSDVPALIMEKKLARA